jgi:hypothetical protein
MDNPIADYLNKLIGDFRRLDSRGVMQVARLIELELDEVFVHPKLRTGSGRPDLAFDLEPDGSDKDEDSPGRLLPHLRRPREETGLNLDELLRRGRRWVILGDPGAGKTTLLRSQALQAAAASLARLGNANHGARPSGISTQSARLYT